MPHLMALVILDNMHDECIAIQALNQSYVPMMLCHTLMTCVM